MKKKIKAHLLISENKTLNQWIESNYKYTHWFRHSRVWLLPHLAVLFHIKWRVLHWLSLPIALNKETEDWVRAQRAPNPGRKWCARNLLFSAVSARLRSARIDGALEQSQGSRSGKTLPQNPTSCRLTQDQIASGGFRSPTKLSIPVWHLRLRRVGRERSLSGCNFPNAHLFCTFCHRPSKQKALFSLTPWAFPWLPGYMIRKHTHGHTHANTWKK